MVSILQEPSKQQKFDFSIIISLSGQLNFFENCLQSLLQQKHGLTIEIILLDDCCSGFNHADLEAILQKNKQQINHTLYRFVYLRHLQKLGYYASINAGLKIANGNWIQFINDGDLLLPNSISSIEKIIAQSTKIDVISGRFYYINQVNEVLEKSPALAKEGLPSKDFLNRLLIENPLHSVAIIYHKEIFSKVGYFNPEIEVAGDWELLRRIVKSPKLYWYYLPEPLACTRVNTKNQSLKAQLHIPEKYVWQIFKRGKVHLSLEEQKIIKKNRYFHCFSEVEELLLAGKMDQVLSLMMDLVEFSALGDRLWLEVLNQSEFKYKKEMYDIVLMLMEKLETTNA